MAEVGLLAPDERVELIDGEIIDMPPIGRKHTSVVDHFDRLFVRAVGDDAIVRVQSRPFGWPGVTPALPAKRKPPSAPRSLVLERIARSRSRRPSSAVGSREADLPISKSY